MKRNLKNIASLSLVTLAIMSGIAGCSKKVTYTEKDLQNVIDSKQVNEPETVNETVKVEETTEPHRPENEGIRSAEVNKVTEVVTSERVNTPINDEAKQQEIIEKIENKLAENKDSYGLEGTISIEVIKFNKADYSPSRYISDSKMSIQRNNKIYYSDSNTESSYKGDKQNIKTTVYVVDSGERTVSYSKSYDAEREDGGKAKWLGATVDRDLEGEAINFSVIGEKLNKSAVRIGEEKVDGVECYTMTCYYPLYDALKLVKINPEFMGVDEATAVGDGGANSYNATIKLYVNKSDYDLNRYEVSAAKALEAYYKNVYEADPNKDVTYQLQLCKASFTTGRYTGLKIDIPDEIMNRLSEDAAGVINEQDKDLSVNSMTLDGDFSSGISLGGSSSNTKKSTEVNKTESSDETKETAENIEETTENVDETVESTEETTKNTEETAKN